ncbi:hypothetical protein CPB83DRAFT_806534 [Crepidotus variabilis]|uniref:Aprataxin C2HE/C2H2/C2HC zinc finger domain-containing protein n=1 Tax=Crepidotus variabilis TaxID=179855 RepID=A0A9P6EPI5_9AGAR|nr:hypothetical protein CPB83DRAFT_806534 [Crepidotus variabilis]
MSSNLLILRKYAQQAVENLPSSVLFKKSKENIVIFDAYPKSIFHFLVLPRLTGQPATGEKDASEVKLDVKRLDSLHALLNGDKKTAKKVIDAMTRDAKDVKKEIEDEMLDKYGFKWDVWIGFHGAPSMAHLHLHVLSADLCSEKLKVKKHYNSFHPKLGFFLHLDEVLSWLDAAPSFFDAKVKDLKPSNYEPVLKEALVCFHCNREIKNVPTLKDHLQEEWDKLQDRAKKAAARSAKLKRKTPEASGNASEPKADQNEVVEEEEPESKRLKLGRDSSSEDVPPVEC